MLACQSEPDTPAVKPSATPTLDVGALKAEIRQELVKDKTREAILKADKLLALNPDDPEGLLLRGGAYAQQGVPLVALKDLDRAVELRPNDVETLTTRARTRLFTKNFKGAKEDLDKACALPEATDVTLCNRAQWYLDQEDLKGAYRELTAATKRFPQSVLVLKLRARVQAALGHKKEAIADAKRALELQRAAQKR